MTEVESKQPLERTSLKPNNMVLENYRVSLSNIIYQVSIAKDGDSWCALIGQNLQNGISGFGRTIQQALHDLADKIKE